MIILADRFHVTTTYRPLSAIRDVAKALGYSQGQQDAWSKQVERHYWTRADTDALAATTR